MCVGGGRGWLYLENYFVYCHLLSCTDSTGNDFSVVSV